MERPDFRKKIAIVGVGTVKRFGELFDYELSDMIIEAYLEALSDARNLEPKDIDAAWFGWAIPANVGGGGSGAVLSEILNIIPKPVTRVENFCATGADALRNACFAVMSGWYDVVLAVGAEKMRDVDARDALLHALVRHGHPLWGKGFLVPSIFSVHATVYFNKFGATKEDLANVAVKNHRNGARNPRAHFQRAVDKGRVLSAPIVSWPLGLYDCCPVTDGAAAAIITRADLAKKFTDTPVYLSGMGIATDFVAGIFTHPKRDFTSFPATTNAANEAYRMARIDASQVDFAEVHDCFTITELLDIEDLGFCGKGDAPRFVKEGEANIGGKIAINPSGGLKSFGHPIGATGIRQVFEAVHQLRGDVEPKYGKSGRQVPDAEIGLCHNLGGTGSIASVLILER
jgi:acetyl-CoA C-acetyltransferase